MRIYIEFETNTQLLKIDHNMSHRIFNVMRKKTGETIRVFNGSQELYATIVDKHTLVAQEQIALCKEEKNTILVYAIVKDPRHDFIIEKCTELGISGFVPIITNRTIKKDLNLDKVKARIISACEQSNRISIPFINKPISFQSWFKSCTQKVLWCYEKATHKIQPLTEHCCILVGPEGGFDEEEAAILYNAPNVLCTSLNTNTLRAETAAMVACALYSR